MSLCTASSVKLRLSDVPSAAIMRPHAQKQTNNDSVTRKVSLLLMGMSSIWIILAATPTSCEKLRIIQDVRYGWCTHPLVKCPCGGCESSSLDFLHWHLRRVRIKPVKMAGIGKAMTETERIEDDKVGTRKNDDKVVITQAKPGDS
jgi:hypothetical protein